MQSCTHGLTLRQPGPKNTRRAVRIAHTTPYAERPPVEHRVGGNLREPAVVLHLRIFLRVFHELQQLRAHELIEHFNRSHEK